MYQRILALPYKTGWVRILIVDDDANLRESLRSLAEELGAQVIAEADNGKDGIEEAARHRPELILLDVSMPIMGGFPAARYLREHQPELHIILISQHNERPYAEEALRIGAKGYMVKGDAASELGPAMHAVMEGGTFVSARLAA